MFNPFAPSFVPANTNTNIFPNPFPNQDQVLRPFFDNVPVVPTEAQINNSTRLIQFSDIENPINSSCPISLEPFEPGMRVMQIIPCQHIFNHSNLNSWFSTNVRCPVCRYDIRVYPIQGNAENQNQSSNETNTTTNTSPNNLQSMNDNNTTSNGPSRTTTLQINSQFLNNYEQFQDQIQHVMEDMVSDTLANSNNNVNSTGTFNIIAGVRDPSNNEINSP